MIFNFVLGIQEINKEKVNINYREAVRAIILHDDSILMVHTNKGDYKFPGGGIDKGEIHEDTLKREVKEETGYIVNNVRDKIGTIIERKQDEKEDDCIFEMISYYYICEVDDIKTVQQLDEYESKLDFNPVWIQLEEAIRLNEEALKKENRNSWVYRETNVLKLLMQHQVLERG